MDGVKQKEEDAINAADGDGDRPRGATPQEVVHPSTTTASIIGRCRARAHAAGPNVTAAADGRTDGRTNGEIRGHVRVRGAL